MRNDELHFDCCIRCGTCGDVCYFKVKNWKKENSGVLVMPVSAVGFVRTFVPTNVSRWF